MNLSQLQGSVYARMGLDANDGLIAPATINGFINESNHIIEQESDWPWLEVQETITMTAGTATYTPGGTATPNLWLRTRFISNDFGEVVEWYSYESLLDRWRNTTTGKPIEWAMYGDTIHFAPVPDSAYAYTHYYQRMEPDLVNPLDTPIMPPTYHNAIIEYASYLGFRASRETDRANEAFQAYTDRLTRMKERAKRRVDLPGRVRVRPGSWLVG